MTTSPIARLAHFWRRGCGNLQFAAGLYPALNPARWGVVAGDRKPASAANPTRVLFVVPHLVAGGADRVCLQIIRGLPAEEFEVHVVATRPMVHEWFHHYRECATTVAAPAGVIMLQPLWDRAFAELLRALSIDVVLCTNSDAFYRGIDCFERAHPGIPLIDILHSPVSIWSPRPFPTAYRAIQRRVCISETLARLLAKEYADNGISESYSARIGTIHNGLDLSLYSRIAQAPRGAELRGRMKLPPEAPLFVYLGRLAEEKDPVLFARSAAEFQRANPGSDACFVVAGDGEDRAAVEAVIAGAPNPRGIRMLGMLTEPDVLALLGTAHSLVMTSTSEGIPYAMLEAMAMRVSFVSTRVGAIPEVIEDGSNGLLVARDGGEVAGIVRALESLLQNSERRESMLDAAERALRPRFELYAMQRAYLELVRAAARPGGIATR